MISGIIGRAEELAELDAALARAGEGRLALTVVVGEAGVGKTTLVGEHARRAERAGALVLRGGCLQLSGGALPYAPIGTLLNHVEPDRMEVIMARQSPQVRAEVSRVFAGLVSDAPPLAPAEPDRFAQGRLFGALLTIVRALTEDDLVELILEDLHLADTSSRDFLRFLLHSLDRARLAIVFTARADAPDEDPFVRDVCHDAGVRPLMLSPLTRAQAAEQLAGLLGGAPAEGLVDRIFRRSSGNPLYTEELATAGDALPETLKRPLLLRAERLSPDARQVLDALAVIARPAEPRLVTESVELPASAIEDALEEALEGRVLVESDAGWVGFRHALLREAVYQALRRSQRRSAHAAVARALETLAEPDAAAELAHHWAQAGESARAAVAAVDAGLAAERVFAFGEALEHYERALAAWPTNPQPAIDRVEVTARAAEAARFTGHYARAVELVEQALAGFDHQLDPARAARLLRRRGRYEPWNLEQSLAAYRAALELTPDRAQQAVLLGDEALTYSFAFDWPATEAKAREAIALAREVRAREAEGPARVVLGVALAFMGDAEAGERELRAGVELLRELDAVEDLCRAHVDLGEVLRLQGRIAEAYETMLAGEAAATRGGAQESLGGFIGVNAAEDLYRLGRWDEAERRLAAMRNRGHGGPTGDLLYASVAGRIDTARGRLDAAAASFAHAEKLRTEDDPPEYIPALFAGWAERDLWAGDVLGASARVRQGLAALAGRNADTLNAPALYAMGARVETDLAAWCEANGGAGAAEARAQALTCADALAALLESAAATPPREALAQLATSRAELRRHDVAAWRDVAAAWETLERPYAVAYASLRVAEALLAGRGGRVEGSAALRDAYARASDLGAERLLAAVVALGDSRGIDPATSEQHAPRSRELPFGLTAREAEVMRLIARGQADKQIAVELDMALRTVHTHVRNILAKLGAANRNEATYRWRRYESSDP